MDISGKEVVQKLMENNTQIPIPSRSESATQVYYFYKLDIGDHMDVDINEPDDLRRVRGAASIYGKRSDKSFVTRSVFTDEGKKSVEVFTNRQMGGQVDLVAQ